MTHIQHRDFKNLAIVVIALTVFNITTVNTYSSTHIYSTPSVCWVLKKLSKYCKIGFLNDSINIYSVLFMCWVLEKLNKYCKIGFLNDLRFQPNTLKFKNVSAGGIKKTFKVLYMEPGTCQGEDVRQ